MKYMIVAWTTSEHGVGEWKILHYSHDLADAEHWYKKFSQMYGIVNLMVDAFEVKHQWARDMLLAKVAKLKGKGKKIPSYTESDE